MRSDAKIDTQKFLTSRIMYSWTWNVTLENTNIHFNILGQARFENPSLTFYTDISERSTY